MYSFYGILQHSKSEHAVGWGISIVARLVMIVDDHAIIRRMLRAALEAEGLQVSEAADGAEGVQKSLELIPSLIILDLSMPVMNGLEAARELKVLMPQVPLLMFSNNAGEILEKEALSAGILAVVRKSDTDSSKKLVAHAKLLLGQGGPGSTASVQQKRPRSRQHIGFRRDCDQPKKLG